MYSAKQIKQYIFITILSCILLVHESYAQNKGLNFQGVARSSSNLIIASKQISVKLSIIQGVTADNVDYTETKTVTTNEQGLFSLVIGDGNTTSSIGNFNTINWSMQPKFLKIDIDPNGGNNFLEFGISQIQYSAYAHFANGVAAENIKGIVPVALGGTGTSSLSQLKNTLGIDAINNTSDLNKPLSTATQTALDLKLNTTGNAATATKLATPKNINGVAFDGSSDITISASADAGTLSGTTLKSTITGSSLTSVGTLTSGAIPYSLLTGTIPTWNQNTTGNAATATKFATTRKINNVDFDGTSDIAIPVFADASTLIGTTLNPTVTNSSLTSVGTLTAGAIPYSLLTGTIPTWNQNTTGNAATATTASTAGTATTATKLATPRNINGIAFDGSGDITISASADAGTLTGTTLKSTITASSLTSVGVLTSTTINGKLTVGSASASSNSAVLEIKSTSQGFLPPKMTAAQRDAIASPSIGLIVYCTNCGSEGQPQYYSGTAWKNMAGGTADAVFSPTVGSNYQGGKVAYVLVSGDTGYDPNVPHGIIAATADQSANSISWNNGSDINTNATGQNIGTGLSNTNIIISVQGQTTTNYAAGLARAYNGGGYSDWHLPSIYELDKLYLNKAAIGGFLSNWYWSSSENNTGTAFAQAFSNGGVGAVSKGSFFWVRAIRNF